MLTDANNMPVVTAPDDAFAAIYNEYYNRLYKYTLYRVGDHSRAEDIVSEIFEKVLLKFNTYRAEKAKFNTWLFTVANNTIINYYKKRNYEPVPLNLERVGLEYSLEDIILQRELKGLLLKAVKSLDERQRNIVALKFGACLTNREIARILDLTESNVGTILYRSLKRLREILKQQGVNHPDSDMRWAK